MKYNFPATKFVNTNTVEEQLDHIESELKEIREATTHKSRVEESIDLSHSVETLLRMFDKRDIKEGKLIVKNKNEKRGYY